MSVADWSKEFDVNLVGVQGMLVLVSSEADAIALLDILSDCGYTWPNDIPLNSHSNWGTYTGGTVYYVYAGTERIIRYGARDRLESATVDRYPGYIRCSFSAVPDLALPDGDAVDYVLL